jgi:hypothetical protein
MSGTIPPGEGVPAPQQATETREPGGAETLTDAYPGQTPHGQPATLVQIAGSSLADIGVRDPSAALLEPLATALFSLDVAPCQEGRAEP